MIKINALGVLSNNQLCSAEFFEEGVCINNLCFDTLADSLRNNIIRDATAESAVIDFMFLDIIFYGETITLKLYAHMVRTINGILDELHSLTYIIPLTPEENRQLKSMLSKIAAREVI